MNQDFVKNTKGANYSSRIFLTAAPNKDSEYLIEKEKSKMQKMFKMRDNVKTLIEAKMIELAKKQKYVVIFTSLISCFSLSFNFLLLDKKRDRLLSVLKRKREQKMLSDNKQKKIDEK